MHWNIRKSGIVEVEDEREGQVWRCAITPGDESLVRETLGDEAEKVIANWTPEQIEVAKSQGVN